MDKKTIIEYVNLFGSFPSTHIALRKACGQLFEIELNIKHSNFYRRAEAVWVWARDSDKCSNADRLAVNEMMRRKDSKIHQIIE